jgi:hypothetical protein
MPTFKVIVKEEVLASIEYEIEANTKEDAAIIGLRKWVIDGEGEAQESVGDRWAEVDGEIIESVDEDNQTTSEVNLDALAAQADQLDYQ